MLVDDYYYNAVIMVVQACAKLDSYLGILHVALCESEFIRFITGSKCL